MGQLEMAQLEMAQLEMAQVEMGWLRVPRRCPPGELRHRGLAVLCCHPHRLRVPDSSPRAGVAAVPATKGGPAAEGEAKVALKSAPGPIDTGEREPRAGLTAGTLPTDLQLFAGPRRRRSLGTRRQKIVAAVVILAALGFLVARGLANAMNYYLTANQAVAQRAQLGTSDFRIQGTVLPGIRQVGTTLHFDISAKQVDVPIVSTGSPPQLFRVGMPVVLDGHWQGDVFSSSQIMVQHGSSYVEAHPAASKSEAPHT
jgi:cytochrome c-type biogenesis protein CcmE